MSVTHLPFPSARVPRSRPAATPLVEEHWYAFGQSCVSVVEKRPRNGEATSASRPALFLLHGRLASREVWHRVDDELAVQYRCLSPDLPGFGRSFSANGRGLDLLEHASLAIELVRAHLLPGQRAILIGHDFGGAVAEICVRELGDRIAGLVLVNASCLQEEVSALGARRSSVAMRRRLRRLLRDCARLPEPLDCLEAVFAGPWRWRYERAMLREAMRAIEESWPGPFERRLWREELRAVRCPVLVLWGMRDRINEASRANELLQLVPEAHLFEDPGSGHWPMLENPAWVTAKIREFVFRIEAGAGTFPVSRARRSL